jgi:transcriptional regulator with XRE-family HTH domain
MPKKKSDPMDVFVGQRVKMARNLISMSQETLGLALKVTFQQVQKYEKGVNRISASKMQLISTALGRPVSWFFDEQPKGKTPTDGADVLTRMLTSPGGVKLAEDYLAIKGNQGRHAVAEVAHALANA